ncbi:MAG: alpha-amylase family glycosyl hydrolase [Sphingorhabdus sp.]
MTRIGKHKPWWQGASLYQIYPLSFSDSNGDGWGDLPGIISRLDYVASLGVDGIWISPFFRSAWTDFGYDTIDQKQVDPRMGTLADFDRLVARAHDLGLKVLIDQVYTYTSNQHPWFIESRSSPDNPKADWYVWADAKPDGGPPNNWQSIFGGAAWAWDAERRCYYMTHFLPEMPHLRVERPDVQQELLSIGKYWLDRGVDGFRLDVINLAVVDEKLRDNPIRRNPNPVVPAQRQEEIYNSSRVQALEFAGRIRKLVDAEPDRFLLGEIAGHEPMATARAYTKGKIGLHSAYFVLGADSATISAITLRTELEAWNNDQDGWPTWSVSNHDIMRAATRVGDGLPTDALAPMLIALLIAARGTALFYQGDELGLPDAMLPYDQLRDPASRRYYPDFLQRDGARTPMPWERTAPQAGFTSGVAWLPIPEAHVARAADGQEHEQNSVLNQTRQLIALRKSESALRDGTMAFVDSPAPVLHCVRADESGRIDCLFNISAQSVEIDALIPAGSMQLAAHGLHGEQTLDPCGFAFFKRGVEG